MPYTPDSQENLFDALQERIEGRTDKLTHFEPGTLNHTLGHDVFAGHFEVYEHALLAMQLSGWINYAGGPVDEEDLVQLGISVDAVDLSLLNRYMNDTDLDALAAQNGVTRDPGDRAEGEALFLTTTDAVTVPAGTQVATPRDSVRFTDADAPQQRRIYETTADATPDAGTTGAIAPIEAARIGPAYNVGPGSVSELIAPPAGVRDVTNQTAITGGELPETNAELRTRAKASTTQGSGGGTAEGITGGLVERVDGLDADDVFIQEYYPDNSDNYVEVTVDGGDDSRVRPLVEDKDGLRPTGIRHILNRPTLYYVEITATLTGAPIDIDRVESEVNRYMSERGIGENVNRATLITAIVNADDDISNITDLELRTDQTGAIEGDLVIDPDEKAVTGSITVNT